MPANFVEVCRAVVNDLLDESEHRSLVGYGAVDATSHCDRLLGLIIEELHTVAVEQVVVLGKRLFVDARNGHCRPVDTDAPAVGGVEGVHEASLVARGIETVGKDYDCGAVAAGVELVVGYGDDSLPFHGNLDTAGDVGAADPRPSALFLERLSDGLNLFSTTLLAILMPLVVDGEDSEDVVAERVVDDHVGVRQDGVVVKQRLRRIYTEAVGVGPLFRRT